LVEILVFESGWVTLSANFRGRGVVHQRILASKNRLPGLSRGVVCVILRLTVLIQYRRVTHTHTQTRDDGYYPRRAMLRAGKNSSFEPPFGGLRVSVHGSTVARWKARCRLPISNN